MKDLVILSIIIICVASFVYFLKTEKAKNQLIDTSKPDSMQVFYSKQLDSINTENRLLNTKIEAKNETIKTLKGLVKENNHYFESITDSALFEDLKKIRSKGVR